GGLEPGAVAASQCAGHGVGGRPKHTEYRVLFWEVVHAAGQPADRSFPGEPVQGQIDRFPAAEIEEVARNEHRASPPPVDACKYPRINALRRLSRASHVRNFSLFFLQDQEQTMPGVQARRQRVAWRVFPGTESGY